MAAFFIFEFNYCFINFLLLTTSPASSTTIRMYTPLWIWATLFNSNLLLPGVMVNGIWRTAKAR